MKTPWIPLIVVAALAGVAGAGLTAATGALKRPAERTATPTEMSGELEAAIDALRASTERLEERVDSLEIMRPAEHERLAVAPVSAVDEDLARNLEDLAAALRSPEGAVPTEFTTAVSRALEDIRAAEDAERDEAREERRLERIDERITELTTELGLGTSQAEDLRFHLVDTDQKRDALRDEIRESGDWRSMRESFGELRDESNEKLQTILTPDQYTKYQELDDGPGFRRGGGGFGGGGDGGGGRRGGN